MAAVLIVTNDGPVAARMAQALRQAGHTPILASDASSALQEAADCPDLVLLDLGLPDLPGEELLRNLRGKLETAHIPVLVITGKREATAHLRGPEQGNVAAILVKPISGAELRRAVDTALADRELLDADALRLENQRQQELIRRLILEGPDPLVFHVHRRLCADRMKTRGPIPAGALTWTEIAEWAKRERLLDAEQARLLRRIPLAGPEKAGKGLA